LEVGDVIYKDNEQIKEQILQILKDENITYKELGIKLETTQQNAYKIVNKNQYKFDDVLKICDILGYKINIDIYKDDGTKVYLDSADEFMSSMTEAVAQVYDKMEEIKQNNISLMELIKNLTTK
jgi:predicted transcriptional regulator